MQMRALKNGCSLVNFDRCCPSEHFDLHCNRERLQTMYYVHVVVQFCFWFNFYFPLFFSMLIYDNEYQTKENQN